MSDRPIERPSARVILIGPGARTLLFRGGDPHRPRDGTWWFTPGGGLDPGETTQEAARRELWEETGQSEVDWGGLVAIRKATFPFMGVTYLSIETFYVAHTSDLMVEPAAFTALEEESVTESRWLDATDIRRLPEAVYPRELASVLGDLSARRFPHRPWRWAE